MGRLNFFFKHVCGQQVDIPGLEGGARDLILDFASPIGLLYGFCYIASVSPSMIHLDQEDISSPAGECVQMCQTFSTDAGLS